MDSHALDLARIAETFPYYSLQNSDSNDHSAEEMKKRKRYCIYIPPKPCSVDEPLSLDSSSDSDSSWTFSAPPTPSSRSPSSHMPGGTPAQEIASRYRERTTSLDATDDRSSSPSLYSEPDSWDSGFLHDGPIQAEDDLSRAAHCDLRPRLRQSCNNGLLETQDEALEVMNGLGLTPTDQLMCQRPGCRDIVSNVAALKYHLHIHNIHDSVVVCPHCKAGFGGQSEMGKHRCRGSFSSKSFRGPFSFLAGVQRMFNKITL